MIKNEFEPEIEQKKIKKNYCLEFPKIEHNNKNLTNCKILTDRNNNTNEFLMEHNSENELEVQNEYSKKNVY